MFRRFALSPVASLAVVIGLGLALLLSSPTFAGSYAARLVAVPASDAAAPIWDFVLLNDVNGQVDAYVMDSGLTLDDCMSRHGHWSGLNTNRHWAADCEAAR